LAKEHPEVGIGRGDRAGEEGTDPGDAGVPVGPGGGDEVAGYFFNGPDTIRRKVRMARAAGLGGVMIWEVGQDFHPADERSLLRAIADEVWPEGRPTPDRQRPQHPKPGAGAITTENTAREL
jgi:hypothetical protein